MIDSNCLVKGVVSMNDIVLACEQGLGPGAKEIVSTLAAICVHRTDPAARHARCGVTLTRWLSWLLGGAFLAAVIVATLHVSEGQAFMRLAET